MSVRDRRFQRAPVPTTGRACLSGAGRHPRRRRARTLYARAMPGEARPMLITLLVIVWLLIWIVALVELIRRKDLTTASKVLWALLILLIPVVGVIVYLVVRPPASERFGPVNAGSPDEGLRARPPF